MTWCIPCWLLLALLAAPILWGWRKIRGATKRPWPPAQPGQE